jgi:phytoene dehydrogenase-like protein
MDAVVVGAGPNGLAAAITLARAGRSVTVFEGADRPGGGLRSDTLTLPGFLHDTCSSVYPLGAASPFFRSLPAIGARWIDPPLAVAHPLDRTDVVWISRSIDETAGDLGGDRAAYARLFGPLADSWGALVDDVLAPPHVPRHPWLMARFGVDALRSATSVASARFRGVRARALFAGLAAHSTLRLDASPSAAVALVLGAMAHAVGWPFAEGGAGQLANILAAELAALGGEILTSRPVASLEELRGARTVLCDVTPRQLLRMAGGTLPARYRQALSRYRYGPGVFKVDWALSEPIPWSAGACRKAGTVHVGGTIEEVATAENLAWEGRASERPFVLVTQPTVCDASRAPEGQHVAWGYCHVPHGAGLDMTTRIEAQVERFAPGFRDTLLARRATTPADLERRNPNLVGGDIAGGVMDL